MDPRRVRAVAKRVVLGFRRDRRSLGLLFAAPVVVLSLVGAVWGSATERVPTVVAATDRFTLPAPIVDRFVASSAIHGRRGSFDDGLRQLRAGEVDAVVWLEGTTVHIQIEGADPLDSGSIGGAIQKALAEAVTGGNALPGGPAVKIDQLYGGPDYSILDYLAPVLVAFFAFFFIFLLSAVSFLRERTSGTLERLMATPLRRRELVLGYLAGFSFFALLQAIVILVFTVFVLKVHYRGNLATIFIVEAVLVVGAVSLGLLVSAAARNELQAVQFVPIVLLPQVFLSGLLIPVDQLPDYLRPVSAVLPLTYANEALRSVMIKGYELADPLVLRDIGVLVAFGIVMAIGAVASIRREVA
ncbi:MAG TPA: ABC transporter permease [Candidatus Limnocylindria bacterium]|jgi:ABC-2 type transport system permease protein|nr:ABC transporter permease [Candidatus Limnocylindria bacterium]